MKRILTGVQSTGAPHLGNVLGAIFPAVSLARKKDNECLYFVADLHSLTSIRSAKERLCNTWEVAAAWMACGFCEERDVLFRQSKIPELPELMWHLSCHVPFPMLANAHAFKERSAVLSKVNVGLFTYPVLMAADVLLYQSEVVPVGKDQVQHIEIVRDIAAYINRAYNCALFALPEAAVQSCGRVVGTDGRKMSKSYGNTINIFAREKQIKEQVSAIRTDSKSLKEPKNPDTCSLFSLYALLAGEEDRKAMRVRYEAGGYGYAEAKEALYRLLLSRFEHERETYAHYRDHPHEVEEKLHQGEQRARKIAQDTLYRCREVLGF